MPVIGFLNRSSPDGYGAMVAAFQEGLEEVGYNIDGQNVRIEYRAEGHYDRLTDMAADFIRQQVSVNVANTPANLIAKNATSTVPIVFTTSSDPVSVGLVTNLNKARLPAAAIDELVVTGLQKFLRDKGKVSGFPSRGPTPGRVVR
jgi:ABC-type uncharacterized transport system substrate-binding protein